MLRPNIVIYRDVSGIILGYTTKPLTFVPKVKLLDGKEPNELFTVADNSQGIPVWVEKALLSKINNTTNSVTIYLKRGLMRNPKLAVMENRQDLA